MSASFEVEKVYYDRRMKQLGQILTPADYELGFSIFEDGFLYGIDYGGAHKLRKANSLDIAIVQELDRLTQELIAKQHASEEIVKNALAKLTDEEKTELGL